MNLEEMRNDIKKQLQKVSDEELKLLIGNHSRAVEYIKKGREIVGAEKLTNDELESIANEMQILAKMELNERSKNN